MSGEPRTEPLEAAHHDPRSGQGPGPATRYEELLRGWEGSADGPASAMGRASAAAREAVAASAAHAMAIRDVAAGVASPALVGYVLWVLGRAEDFGLERLCFLSRDAQVFYEIAKRLTSRLGLSLDLRYVHSSRRTWSLAAADASDLSRQDWLFNSFIRSNAEDVCARLGLPLAEFAPMLADVGASLDPDVRADQPHQSLALRRFAALPAVSAAAGPRIHRMCELVREYAVQEGMTSAATGLVDAGWTGRMIGALTAVTAGLDQPKVFFWAHEPRVSGWTDPARVSSYMYNTATKEGLDLRVPDTPYVIETFCMSTDGIIADYRRALDGRLDGVAETPSNRGVEAWGFNVYRETIYRFCDALDQSAAQQMMFTDVRPVISSLLHAFWIMPAYAEAVAWGAYPYDSDPLARATRPLARPFDPDQLRAVSRGEQLNQEDRAWLQGSLALSGAEGAEATAVLAPRYEIVGTPATN